MTIIEKIRAEIERLYDGEAPKHDQQCEFEDGYFMGIDTISNIIDSLESEKPMEQDEDLNEEIKKFIEEYGYEKGADKLLIAIVARHFAQWGAEHLK